MNLARDDARHRFPRRATVHRHVRCHQQHFDASPTARLLLLVSMRHELLADIPSIQTDLCAQFSTVGKARAARSLSLEIEKTVRPQLSTLTCNGVEKHARVRD